MAKYCSGCKKGEKPTQATVITKEQLLLFLMNADSSNRHIMVRKAAAVIAVAGGTRIHDLWSLTIDSLTKTSTGYRVVFVPSKQQKELKTLK